MPNLCGNVFTTRWERELTLFYSYLDLAGTVMKCAGKRMIFHSEPVLENEIVIIPMMAVADIRLNEHDKWLMTERRTSEEPSAFHPQSAEKRIAINMIRERLQTPIVIVSDLKYRTHEINTVQYPRASDLIPVRRTIIHSVGSVHVRFAPLNRVGATDGPTMIALSLIREGISHNPIPERLPAFLWIPPSQLSGTNLEVHRVPGPNGLHFGSMRRPNSNPEMVNFLEWVGHTSLTENGFANPSDEVRFAAKFLTL